MANARRRGGAHTEIREVGLVPTASPDPVFALRARASFLHLERAAQACRDDSARRAPSAGVADLPSGADDDGTRLLERADKALYHSKAVGRDRVSLFSPEQRWAAAS